jgi:hypothetical protein
MELIDLSLIKPMLIRSLENPEAIKNFINGVIFWWFIGIPICIITTIIILSIIFKTFRDVTKWWDTKEENKRKPGFWKSLFNNIKFYIKKYQDFFVWLILLSLSRMFVSLVFRCISSWMTTWIDLHMNSFSDEELRLLGARSLYTLLFFVIAPIFIMFSLWNKFIRNIWIFIYMLWILFVPLWRFLQLWYTWNNYYTEDTSYQYVDHNSYILLPDSVEITVKNEIIEWEAVDLSITIIKDWKKMDDYEWTIFFRIVDEDWDYLNPNIHILPDWGLYTFYPTDSWQKNFQKWLEIKREWVFYIEVEDLNDIDETILWRQKITVIKKN